MLAPRWGVATTLGCFTSSWLTPENTNNFNLRQCDYRFRIKAVHACHSNFQTLIGNVEVKKYNFELKFLNFKLKHKKIELRLLLESFVYFPDLVLSGDIYNKSQSL